MKKLLFAAILVAGTTFGFAKDNVQNPSSYDNNLVKTEVVKGKKLKTYKFSTQEEAKAFLQRCLDIYWLEVEEVSWEVDGDEMHIIVETYDLIVTVEYDC